MRTTERIPGFAICARCATRRELSGCQRCGILVCGDCRGDRQCAVCRDEHDLAAAGSRRRAAVRELGRRAAVVALVAASGVAGMGAALVPPGPLCADAPVPISVELELMGQSALATPPTLESAPPPWSKSTPRLTASYQGLSFRCFSLRSKLTCCIVDMP